MGPCRRRARSTRKSRKALQDLKNEEASSMVSSSTTPMSPAKSSKNRSEIDDDHHREDFESIDVSSSSSNSACCSTPKADRFRIPEITTCPPAPKKRRIVRSCSLQRTPMAFYAPPDLELFFFFALRDVSV